MNRTTRSNKVVVCVVGRFLISTALLRSDFLFRTPLSKFVSQRHIHNGTFTHKALIRFIVTIGCLLVAFLSAGQNFSLGLKAGPSLTWTDFNRDVSGDFGTQPKLGYTVGGIISFPLKNRFSFVSEFAYTLKGRRVTFNEGTWENNATYRFFDMSMALRKSYNLKLRKDVYTRWFFNIGPNIEYWLGGQGTVSTDVADSKYTVVFDKQPDANFHNNYINDANRWLFGIDVGIGADATISKVQRVNLELRFTYGHTYLGKKNSSSSLEILGFQDTLLANLKTLTLTASYYFDFDLKKSKMGRSNKDKQIKRKR